MFDGILSDVIGRDGHVSKTGNGNKNNNSSSNGGGGGDSCTKRFSFDESTTRPPDVAPSRSMVGMFERHVTRYHNHLLRMRDPPVVTSSPTDALPALTLCQCDRDDVDIDTLTSVSHSLMTARRGVIIFVLPRMFVYSLDISIQSGFTRVIVVSRWDEVFN